jgi:hypothetical protein
MELFHGSNQTVKSPNITHSRGNLDFGRGFYTTTNYSQACNFATLVTSKRGNGVATVSVYQFEEQKLHSFNSKLFNGITEEWLDFVAANRLGLPVEHYDLIVGPVADDKVIETVQLYIAGVLSKEAALVQLKVNQAYDQIVFLSECALSAISFEKAEIV